jgi:cell division protein FtsB
MINQESEKRDNLLRVVARYFKYNKIALIFIVLIIIQIIISIFGSKGLLTRIRINSERKQLEQQLQQEIRNGEYLKKEIDELNNSDKKIEKVAREKYGMTKEGEKIYRIKVDSSK